MLICVCNLLTRTRVEAAIAAGATTPAEVYKRCGVRRNCANCQGKIKVIIRETAKRVEAAE